MNNSAIKRTRFAQRLTPMTLMGRASAEGLEKVCLEVLAPHFHQEPFQRRKVCGCLHGTDMCCCLICATAVV